MEVQTAEIPEALGKEEVVQKVIKFLNTEKYVDDQMERRN